MGELFWVFLSAFSSFWDQFLFMWLIDRQLPEKKPRLFMRALAVLLLWGVLLTMRRLGFPNMVRFPAMFLLLLGYCFIFRSGSTWQRLQWPIVTMGMLFLADQLTTIVMITLFRFDVAILFAYTDQRLVGVSFYMLIATTVFFSVSRLRFRSRILPLSTQVASLALAAICVFISAVILDYMHQVTDETSLLVLNLITIGFMITTGTWIFLIDRLSARNDEFNTVESENLALRAERQSSETLQVLYERLIILRHDYKNHISAFAGLVRDGDIDGLREYVTQLNPEYGSIDAYALTKIPALDALLTTKLLQAADMKIDVEHFLVVPKELPIPLFDLCSIMGNILDNAIEASSKVSEGRRYLELVSDVTGELWTIRLTNSCTGVYRRDNERKLLTTKLVSGHGIGLQRVSKLVEDNGGRVFVKPEADSFRITIALSWKGE